ncbi:MAG: tRNA (N6-threonylcarbamoyladenosine(37)-N6)-methyltransferase TrmO [Nitrososphaerota archaeon]
MDSLMTRLTFNPIGVVKVDIEDELVKDSFEGVEGRLEIFEEYMEGLEGIDGFTHLIVIAYLHKVTDEQRRVLKVKHKRLLRLGLDEKDLPEVGVFCTDSPHRPNPIALTIVEVVRREKNILYVKKLDLFDGTPIIDIKPYTLDRAVVDLGLPEWYIQLRNKVEEKVGRKYQIHFSTMR